MEDEQPLVSGETETTISGGIQTPSEVTSSPSEGLPTIIIATIAAIALIGVAGIILLLLKRRKE